jgi:RNA polymerase sigma-70 factor (ECF subfamily)
MSSVVARSESSSGLSLAARLNEGSSNAWRELVDLYGPLIDSWCRQAGVAEASRADIGQEVLLAVHRGIASFDPAHPRATFRGWLWKITRNAVLQWRRRHEAAGIGGSTALARLAEVPDPWGETEGDSPPADSNDTATLISRALDQIRVEVEEHTWNAFWNTAVLGQLATETAIELGMTAMAVRQAKSRVLRRLRKQLGDLS